MKLVARDGYLPPERHIDVIHLTELVQQGSVEAERRVQEQVQGRLPLLLLGADLPNEHRLVNKGH